MKKYNKQSESDTSSSSECQDAKKCTRRNRQQKKEHRRNRSCSSSSSSSSSGSSSRSRSCSSSSSSSRSRSRSSSSSSSTHKHCDFQDIYNYYKNRLVCDNELMVAGSNAYIQATNSASSIIPRSYSIELANTNIQYNVDHLHPNAPFFVREDGIYVISFSAVDDNPGQWTIFVNGKLVPNTTSGTNAGAGQAVFTNLLFLKKNDAVLVRNFSSNAVAINTALYAGGELPGNDINFLLFKIAPLCTPQLTDDCEFEKKCHKYRKLYKKLLDKMLCDKELMMKGYNVHGSFYDNETRTYLVGDDVELKIPNNVAGIEMIAGVNPSGSPSTSFKVLEDGIYKLYFFIDSTTACQFTYTVNGVPIEYTTQGTNRGSGQMNLHSILALKKNDIVTVRNWKSNSSSITTQVNAGGNQIAMNTNLTIYKIAPLDKPTHNHSDHHIPEHIKKCYEQFREYLLRNHRLQIAGTPVIASTNISTYQAIPLGAAIDWEVNKITRESHHTPGMAQVTVHRDGIYTTLVDLITDEPSQITIFVNGVPDLTTVTGRDSGSSKVCLRQFIKLKCGDVLTVHNYESNAGTLKTARNPGGTEPGNSAQFALFRLSHDNCYEMGEYPPMCKKDAKEKDKKNKK